MDHSFSDALLIKHLGCQAVKIPLAGVSTVLIHKNAFRNVENPLTTHYNVNDKWILVEIQNSPFWEGKWSTQSVKRTWQPKQCS